MKAARFSRFGGPEVLEIVDLPDPHAGPGEIRIEVRAAGVNASDWKKRQGLMDQELPQTLGYEASGVVDEIGDGVCDLVVGDRVFGASPYGAAQAELAVLSYWAPIPDSLDDAMSAALPAAARDRGSGARPAGRHVGRHAPDQWRVRECRERGRSTRHRARRSRDRHQ
jgi:NADPH:quinone reductase-like Zn-dependent oxidoreductase